MKYGYKEIHELTTLGYLDARKNERAVRSALAFELDLEHNVAVLAQELHARKWKPGAMEWFVTDTPTIREIFAPSFRDRIVSHILFNLLSPIYERYFISDTCSCRKGKGTLYGIARFEHHIRSVTDNYKEDAWLLNLDISGYFMSIDRMRLRALIGKTLEREKRKSPEAIDYGFAEYLVDAFLIRDPMDGCVFVGDKNLIPLVPPSKSLFGRAPGIGLPIGDVINQLNSNIYLAPFDELVKRELKIKNYVRYVDDGKIFHRDYDYLLEVKARCGEFLDKELGLTLHPEKTTITNVYDSPMFLGAVIKPYRRYARNKTMEATKTFFRESEKALENGEVTPIDLIPRLNSRLGYLGNFNEWRAINRMLERCPNIRAAFNFTQDLKKATIIKQ